MRRVRIVPVLLIIFALSYFGMITVERYLTKIEVKEQVIKVTKKIEAGRLISNDQVQEDKISRDWLSDVQYIRKLSDLEGMYARETLLPGDIIRKERVARKDEVVGLELKKGYERISVKVHKPENAVSFQFKTGNTVSLDCTVDYEIAKSLQTEGKEVLTINAGGAARNALAVVRLLDGIQVLAVCDKNGNVMTDGERLKSLSGKADSILFDVTKRDAQIIQALRQNNVFEVTKVSG